MLVPSFDVAADVSAGGIASAITANSLELLKKSVELNPAK